MKLIELTIHNFRGIRDLTLAMGGENFLVWGPNGSGKSGVIDSIDFLLTGGVGRLSGEGTKGLSVKEHGTHIDAKPDDSWVKGEIELQDGTRFKITRKVLTTTKPEYENPPPDIELIFELLARRHHVLTRRDILHYIASEAGNRAKDVQAVLNLSELEQVRAALVKARNEANKAVPILRKSLANAEAGLNVSTGKSSFNEAAILKVVNNLRSILGANAISSLVAKEVKLNVLAPQPKPASAINYNSVLRDIETLSGIVADRTTYENIAADLRKSIDALQADPDALRTIRVLGLSKLGLTLLEDTGECPLCDMQHEEGYLRLKLERRISKAQTAIRQQADVTTKANLMLQSVSTIVKLLDGLSAASDAISKIDTIEITEKENEKRDSAIESWRNEMLTLQTALSGIASSNIPSGIVYFDISVPGNLNTELEFIKSQSDKLFPKLSPELEAWTTLTKIETGLIQYHAQASAFTEGETLLARCEYLSETYNLVKDAMLTKLYEGIRDRFVELYRALHGDDEASFTAALESEQAGLDLLVDFYGRGLYPPNALHSEGHQDSMGLCLYLALAEHIYGDIVGLTVLDDVVMSVDASHRSALCKMLTAMFPTKQFIITTHDQVWAKQLVKSGVVKAKNSKQFYSWNLATGPKTEYVESDWTLIHTYLSKDDVVNAAGTLRRLAEEFLQEVCQSLEVPVVYKMNGQYELGELIIPASEKYKKLLSDAVKAAKEKGDATIISRVELLEKNRNENRRALSIDDWMVNYLVHYNNWANFTPTEFSAVVGQYRTFFEQFRCGNCNTWLTIESKSRKAIGASCSCGAIHFDL